MTQHIHFALTQKTNKQTNVAFHFELEVLMKGNSQLNLTFAQLGSMRPSLDPSARLARQPTKVFLVATNWYVMSLWGQNANERQKKYMRMQVRKDKTAQQTDVPLVALWLNRPSKAWQFRCFCETKCYVSTKIAPIKWLSWQYKIIFAFSQNTFCELFQ